MARAEGEGWRRRAQTYLSGLAEEIEKQFEEWQLTAAEREVALLMLKGFSHAEIAGLRGTTEATVRHQARAAYQKSGLPNRTSFCAYFLEDLLPARAPPCRSGHRPEDRVSRDRDATAGPAPRRGGRRRPMARSRSALVGTVAVGLARGVWAGEVDVDPFGPRPRSPRWRRISASGSPSGRTSGGPPSPGARRWAAARSP